MPVVLDFKNFSLLTVYFGFKIVPISARLLISVSFLAFISELKLCLIPRPLGRLLLGVRGICSPAYASISRRNLQYPAALPWGFFILAKINSKALNHHLYEYFSNKFQQIFIAMIVPELALLKA
jgi:hypothetical protein